MLIGPLKAMDLYALILAAATLPQADISSESSLGASVADLEIRMEVISSPPYQADDAWILAVSVKNHGPEETPSNVFVESARDFPQNRFIPGPADCNHGFISLPLNQGFWFFSFPQLSPGQSSTCVAELLVNVDPVFYEANWFINAGGSNWVDPDPSNNRWRLLFDPNGQPAKPVIVPTLNRWGAIALSCILAIVSGVLLVRRNCGKSS